MKKNLWEFKNGRWHVALCLLFIFTLHAFVHPMNVQGAEAAKEEASKQQLIKQKYFMGSVAFLISAVYMTLFFGCMDFTAPKTLGLFDDVELSKSSSLGGGMTLISLVVASVASMIYLGSEIFLTNDFIEEGYSRIFAEHSAGDAKQATAFYEIYLATKLLIPVIRMKIMLTDMIKWAFSTSALIALGETKLSLQTFDDLKAQSKKVTGKKLNLEKIMKAAAVFTHTDQGCKAWTFDSSHGPSKFRLFSLLDKIFGMERTDASDSMERLEKLNTGNQKILGLEKNASFSSTIVSLYRAVSVKYKENIKNLEDIYTRWMFLPSKRYVMFSTFAYLTEEAALNLRGLEDDVLKRLNILIHTCAQVGKAECVEECKKINCKANQEASPAAPSSP